MLDFLKQVFEAWSERIRSPILGSIALVFVAANWKPLFYLFFADKSVAARLQFFEANTDCISLYAVPLGLGLLIAFGSPWLTLCGAWLAKRPKSSLHRMQTDEARANRIHEYKGAAQEEEARATLEAAREQRKIEAAKRLQEAETIGDGDLSEELKREREASSVDEQEEPITLKGYHDLSDYETFVLQWFGTRADQDMRASELEALSEFYRLSAEFFKNFSRSRLKEELFAAVERLKSKSLVSESYQGILTLTKTGWALFDELQTTDGD